MVNGIFFVASRGLTATTWFKNALSLHSDIFCSHGRDRPNRGIETDSLLLDKAYRVDRLNYEKWQRGASIDNYTKDLISASSGEQFIGNIHGYVLIELMDKLSKSDLENIPVANMVRHPIGFIESYVALVNHRKNDYPEKFYAEHGKRIVKNKQLIVEYKVNSGDLSLLGFIEACQSLKKSIDEIRLHQVYIVKMEEVVSNKKYFLDVFYYLTGGLLNYDENVLDKVLKVNSHKEKYNKIKTDSRNLECHDETWREWSSSVRQDIFMEILSKEDIFVYQEHGYNLDFIY
jgi:hypothetical protein